VITGLQIPAARGFPQALMAQSNRRDALRTVHLTGKEYQILELLLPKIIICARPSLLLEILEVLINTSIFPEGINRAKENHRLGVAEARRSSVMPQVTDTYGTAGHLKEVASVQRLLGAFCDFFDRSSSSRCVRESRIISMQTTSST